MSLRTKYDTIRFFKYITSYIYYFHILIYFCGIEPPADPIDPCYPSPCGPYSKCRVTGATAACTCLPNYIGRPPNCKPECMINEECAGNLACLQERCRDPCPGSCGNNAICSVIKHSPICHCIDGYTGDPFSGCTPVPSKYTLYKWNHYFFNETVK